MKSPACDLCTKPVGDQARLCGRCWDLLARDLGDVPALADELDISRTRQSRRGKDGSGLIHRSEDRPLPWDETASESIRALRVVLVGWVRVVCEERGVRPPTDTLPAMAAFLLTWGQWLRHHPAAAECATTIGTVVRDCRRTIDVRAKPDLTWIGPCRTEHLEADVPFCCVAEVRAPVGRERATCQECGGSHDVAKRQAWLLDEAEDQLVPSAVLAPALSRLGWKLEESTVRSWVARGRLVAHGLDVRGHQTFRVGDVLELLRMEAVRRAELAAKRAEATAKRRVAS